MRVLITGADGFIGRWLIRELTEHGHEIVALDRAEGNLLHPGFFAAELKRRRPDAVVHLAAQVGRLFGEDNVSNSVRSNAEMTAIVAHACGDQKVQLVYASTSEVYGDQDDRVCHEDGPLELPHNVYGLTKRFGEELCRLYAPKRLRILRLSMPIGAGHPPRRGRAALTNVLWQAHHRKPIVIHRGAERSWCDVRDTVAGIRLILKSDDTSWPTIYNVGRDDQAQPMVKVAEIACDMTGCPRELISVVDPPSAQTVVKRLSTAKLQGLGWMPVYDLPETMEQVYRWVRQFDADGRRLSLQAAKAAA